MSAEKFYFEPLYSLMNYCSKKPLLGWKSQSCPLACFMIFLWLFCGELTAQDCQPLSIQATIKNASCGLNNDGSIELRVTGGQSPYHFQWSDGSKTKSLERVSAGSYVLMVTDAQGCQTKTTYQITSESAFSASCTVRKPTTPDSEDGAIALKVQGGKPPYKYLISDYSDLRHIKRSTTLDPYLKDLSKGNYIIDIQDATGCMTTLSINLLSETK